VSFSDKPLAAGQTLALAVEYNGSLFHGWQRQGGTDQTVQEALEKALSQIANHDIRVACAGRTDAGVHATSQVVSFKAPVARSLKAWVVGSNAVLPPTVRVHWASAVPEEFHARFSATQRAYRYLWCVQDVRPTFLLKQVTWSRNALCFEAMHQAAQSLVGEQDFSAFRAASCQSRTPFRDVQAVSVIRRGPFVVMDIQANAFLHHMVRNIAGSLSLVGRGIKPVSWINELLQGKDRTIAADTAPPDGLYLTAVAYPSEYQLPDAIGGPIFLPQS
jgi:tRNA pseudouridine38-40 synthase